MAQVWGPKWQRAWRAAGAVQACPRGMKEREVKVCEVGEATAAAPSVQRNVHPSPEGLGGGGGREEVEGA